jgi:hypothetical protein
MDFNAIFSLTVLATYLRYPQIEGLNDELLSKGLRAQLERKRKNADLRASRSPLSNAKRSRISSLSGSEPNVEVTKQIASEDLSIKANEFLMQPNLQLSLSKETAFPRKSRYDKGKNKASYHLPENLSLVGPLAMARKMEKGRKSQFLICLQGRAHLGRRLFLSKKIDLWCLNHFVLYPHLQLHQRLSISSLML